MSRYVPVVSGLSRDDIEGKAEAILARHYPDHLATPMWINVLDLFDHVLPSFYGLVTGTEKLSDGVEGMTFPDGRVLLSESTYRGAHYDVGRDRFTTAHECGHGLLHRHQIRNVLINTGGLVLYRRSDVPAYRDPEWQANAFAAAILMPRRMVRALDVRTSSNDLASVIIDVFKVSRPAAEYRIKDLKIT